MIIIMITTHTPTHLLLRSSSFFIFFFRRLLSQGYSIESIASATLEADTISKERNMSVSKQKWDGVNEMSERFGRFFRKSVSRRNSLTGSGSSSMTPPKKQSIAANSA